MALYDRGAAVGVGTAFGCLFQPVGALNRHVFGPFCGVSHRTFGVQLVGGPAFGLESEIAFFGRRGRGGAAGGLRGARHRRSCPDPLARHLGEPQQVLKTEWRTPASRHHRGIRWRKVRPAHGNRPDRAVRPLHRDPVFSPEGLGHHEREAGAPERMERVGDPNLWCFNSTGSILQL